MTLHEGWNHGWFLLHPAEQTKILRRLRLMALGGGGGGAAAEQLRDDALALAVPPTPPTALALANAPTPLEGGVPSAAIGGSLGGRKRRVSFYTELDDGDTASVASVGSSSDADSPKLSPTAPARPHDHAA